MQMVDPGEWDLSGMVDRDRAARLLDPLPGEDLIVSVAAEAMEAALDGRSSWGWQDGDHMAECGRGIASFPLHRDTFDALFNGRSGYRAQYYLSCQEGANFNAMLIGALLRPLSIACERAAAEQAKSLQHSFGGPYSKIWVLCDGGPFNAAPEGEFKPRRWFKNNPVSVGLRAPVPELPGIQIKGSWINHIDRRYRQDIIWKGDRHCTLAETGFV
jgi:hypothetical protein